MPCPTYDDEDSQTESGNETVYGRKWKIEIELGYEWNWME